MRRKLHSERDQLELFRAIPGDLAPRDAQDLMAYPFFSLAKTKRIVPIDFRAGAIAIRVESVPEHGMATIWDADVLIWAASQIVEARERRFEDVAAQLGVRLVNQLIRLVKFIAFVVEFAGLGLRVARFLVAQEADG